MMNTTTVCPHGYRLPAESCPSCQADRTMRELHELRADISRLKADAELGELVRRMPGGWQLRRIKLSGRWHVHFDDDSDQLIRYCDPVVALKTAMGESTDE